MPTTIDQQNPSLTDCLICTQPGGEDLTYIT
jgi:hypothetical protein